MTLKATLTARKNKRHERRYKLYLDKIDRFNKKPVEVEQQPEEDDEEEIILLNRPVIKFDFPEQPEQPNQTHGKIYKITSSETTDVYVGSTTQSLKTRFCGHRYNYTSYLKGHADYIKSYEVIKYVDAKIELLFEGRFNAVADLHRLEGEYILSTENCINKYVPGRTRSEKARAYTEANREKIKEQKKTYRLENLKKLTETHICSVCQSQYKCSNKARHMKSKTHQQALSLKLTD